MINDIPVENLLIDLRNPRYEPRTSQREALATIAHVQGNKLFNLAQDIIRRGLSPIELPIVTGPGSDGLYTVLEGNRRVAAIKLLASPSLVASLSLSKGLVKKYHALAQQHSAAIPQIITCSVMTVDEARHWIDLKHTGQNDGIGIVEWDGVQTQRFRGISPALQIIELVRDRGDLDEQTKEKLPKIRITNIQRLVETKGVRPVLGIEIDGNKKTGRVVFTEPEEVVVARLSMMVSDIANQTKNVSNFRDVLARVSYAQDVVARVLSEATREPDQDVTAEMSDEPDTQATLETSEEPETQNPPATSDESAAEDESNTEDASATSDEPEGQTSPATPSKTVNRRITPLSKRKYLIPTSFKIPIKEPRINEIYRELQELEVDKFANCCAVMLRVFLELSLDNFAQKNNIQLTTPPAHVIEKAKAEGTQVPRIQEMKLHQKADTVTKYLGENNILTSSQLQPIRAVIAGTGLFSSIETLHGFVHSTNYRPIPGDLKTTWDNIQPFMEVILTKV